MITNGSIEFQYPSNYADGQTGAKVTLGFMVPEGTDDAGQGAIIDKVAAMAKAKALALVGKAVSAVVETNKAVDAAVVETLAKKEPIIIGAPRVADPMGMIGVPPAAPSAPAVVSAPSVMQDIVSPDTPTSSAPAASGLDDLMPPPAVTTDKQLIDAITHRNGVLVQTKGEQATVIIRALIGEFVPPPGRVNQIPQERRQEFLARLGTLQ